MLNNDKIKLFNIHNMLRGWTTMKRAPFNIADFDKNPFELLDKEWMLVTQPLHL